MTPTATIADAFLADIIDHPDDDASRLVFADWLEENGEAERAEFIRVQVRLARATVALWQSAPFIPYSQGGGFRAVGGEVPAQLSVGDHLTGRFVPETHAVVGIAIGGLGEPTVIEYGPVVEPHIAYQSFEDRESERRLLDSALPADPDDPCYFLWDFARLESEERFRGYGGRALLCRRGFAESVRLPLQAWLDHGPALVRRHPVERVVISDREPYRLDSGGGRCSWREDGRGWRPYSGGDGHARSLLSPVVFAMLPGPAASISDGWVTYGSPGIAWEAANTALLAWARSHPAV